jgi:hypothetical protein
MSEDPRMAIFDAAAFVLVFFSSINGPGRDSRNSDIPLLTNLGSLN